MDASLELQLLRDANAVLMARNERLRDALGAMLNPHHTDDEREAAGSVWRKECGVAE